MNKRKEIDEIEHTRNIKKQDILKKIKLNNDELDNNIKQKFQIEEQIKKIKKDTSEEFNKMLKDFDDKHGLTQLKNQRDILNKHIKKCNTNNNKYGGCRHPKYARTRASRGWSDSYLCTICGYEDIDELGPGN